MASEPGAAPPAAADYPFKLPQLPATTVSSASAEACA
eukprot:SAG22_NODE_17490_length_304_cov_0.385366_1_plen_36_part_10